MKDQVYHNAAFFRPEPWYTYSSSPELRSTVVGASHRKSSPERASMRSDAVTPVRGTKPVYAGQVTKGRVKHLWGGQGSGIISAARGDVFFHKSDVNGKYWDLKVGERVVFELLDDPISGPRAQNVRLAPPRKAR